MRKDLAKVKAYAEAIAESNRVRDTMSTRNKTSSFIVLTDSRAISTH